MKHNGSTSAVVARPAAASSSLQRENPNRLPLAYLCPVPHRCHRPSFNQCSHSLELNCAFTHETLLLKHMKTKHKDWTWCTACKLWSENKHIATVETGVCLIQRAKRTGLWSQQERGLSADQSRKA